MKKGKLPVSHRYNRIPLLRSRPGGILQELIVQDLPGTKIRNFQVFLSFFSFNFVLCFITGKLSCFTGLLLRRYYFYFWRDATAGTPLPGIFP